MHLSENLEDTTEDDRERLFLRFPNFQKDAL